MTIALIGIDYRSARLDIREQLARVEKQIQAAVQALCSSSSIAALPVLEEGLLLSTCNRMEIYFSCSSLETALQSLRCELAALVSSDILPLIYTYTENAAVDHLMRVSCGLESMVLGETQILGQVAQALANAQATGISGAVLSRLFSQALHAGKRARHETKISRHTTSVSHASVLFLLEKLPNPSQQARVLVIGAGEMASLAAHALAQTDIQQLGILNRSRGRAEALAKELHAVVFDWEALEQALQWADAVIFATAASQAILSYETLGNILLEREVRPLVLVDIGVPRNVDVTVNRLPLVHYYDIDAIQSLVDSHVELRKAAIPQVETIIENEHARFTEWFQGRQVAPTIIQLREWAQHIAQEELEEALTRLGGKDERTQEIVSLLAHRLMNRFLHEPTTRLRLQAAEGKGDDYAQALRDLFALQDPDPLQITG